ncbi:MAG TPA: FeoB small GTPase domain-containing protein [Elusimicrobiales bacterium]|nr:FeoB small GTPase domain-containing protein [Elusimicrobiales bacterium]
MTPKTRELTDLLSAQEGERGYVQSIEGGPGLRSRLRAMGIIEGRQLHKVSPLSARGPVITEVLGTRVAIGRNMAVHIKLKVRARSVLLTGNPNVGKSVVFSRLTGLDVISSNYPGTTVEYTSGSTMLAGHRFQLTDVPGAYSLEPTNKAEEAAAGIINSSPGDLVLDVLDATNLERNLFFAMQMLEKGLPVIFLLNKWDIAERRGIHIDVKGLETDLGARFIPLVATTGEGLKELDAAVAAFLAGRLPAPICPPPGHDEKWKLIGRIAAERQRIEHRHPGFLEKLADLTSRPSTGLPAAAAVLALSFYIIRFIGEGLIGVLEPLFNDYYMPLLLRAADLAPAPDWLKAMLLGVTPAPMESFGLLTTGLFIPFIVVLPYILAFYLILSLLEDLGYLPRLAVLLDDFMHRLGLHGYGTIPVMLGLGCKVPGILAARVLETRRERVIATALALMVAPCMPQSAMILSLLAPHGMGWVFLVFGTIAATGLTAGAALNRFTRGEAPELFVEIPPYHLPPPGLVARKVWIRIKEFLLDAVPMIMLGVFLVNLADMSGALTAISGAFKGPLEAFFGLPGETVSVMVLGFLKKDISIAMLAPFGLAPAQIAVASVFLALYLPCLASLLVMVRELGAKESLGIALLNLASASVAAALLHLALTVL